MANVSAEPTKQVTMLVPTVKDNELLQWEPTKAGLQHKLGELVQFFQIDIPTNASGLPISYIDPKIINQQLLNVETADDVSDQLVAEATTPIDFDEGFPTVQGVPLWERLDGEPVPYYNLYKAYRQMKYVQGSRSIAKLADQSGMLGRHLNALSRIYHWQLRVKAFDQYKALEQQIERQHKVEALESRHAKFANDMLEQAGAYLEEHPEQMTPKTAIQLAELAMRAGRLALGLNPDKPGEGGPTHATNIMISNNNADSIVNVSGGGPGKGGVNPANNDMQYLQEVMAVLSRSGAIKQNGNGEKPADAAEVIDVTPTANANVGAGEDS